MARSASVVPMMIYIEPEIHDWLKAQAANASRSVSKESCRILMAEYRRAQARKEKKGSQCQP